MERTTMRVWMGLVMLGAVACGPSMNAEPAAPAAPPAAPPAPPAPASPLATGPAAAATPSPTDTPKPAMDPAKAILGYVEAFNTGRVDEAVKAFGADGEWISAGSLVRPAKGPAEIATAWKELKSIFDIQVGLRRVFLTPEVWVAEGVLSGTQVGAFHGLAPTKKPVGVGYVHIGWVKDGHIQKLMSLSNGVAFTTQIGFTKGIAPAVPAAPTGAPEILKDAGDAASLPVADAVIGALFKGDLAAAKSNLGDKVTFVDHASATTASGADGAQKLAATAMKGLSGLTREQKTFSAGPYVVSYGEVKGDAVPQKGTGKLPVVLHFLEVLKLEGGKVVAIELYRNPKEILDALATETPAKGGK